MIKTISHLYYWILDYIYVAREQVADIFSRSTPSDYRNDGGQPVLLIPGIYENWRFMRPVAKHLHSKGYDVHTIEGLGYNRGTIEAMALVVEHYIRDQHLTGAIIVAHSKGGLIGKHVLTLFKRTRTLKGLVTLNTPFSGSRYATLFPFKSVKIFAPTSETLSALAKDTRINRRIVSIYGLFDPHIPGGSALDGAHNVQLQTHGHFRIMKDPRVHEAIINNVSRLNRDVATENDTPAL